MDIKWLVRKSHLDTNKLHVEWLGAKSMKQEVGVQVLVFFFIVFLGLFFKNHITASLS